MQARVGDVENSLREEHGARVELMEVLGKIGQYLTENLCGELGAVVPGDAEHVATMLYGDDEVAALYLDGFAAFFEDGARFVRFADIATYTRVPVPGASFHVHTEKEHLKIADGGLRELGQLLDFLYGRDLIPDA